MNGKRMRRALMVGLAVWAALLFALTAAERGTPGAGIKSFWDAAWYSVATLTTAGYGDLVPVSAAGKWIGVLLMALSVGLWGALIGFLWAAFRDTLLPTWRLFWVSRHPWWVFSERNEAAEALAKELLAEHPDSRVIFCGESAKSGENGMTGARSVPWDILSLLQQAPSRKAARTAFLMSEDGWANAAQATALVSRCTAVYSRGEKAVSIPGVRCFDSVSLCARQYWQAHPAGAEETVFLLIGGGAQAQALLCEGLLACCREPFQATVFHVFGDWADFCRLHPDLNTVVFHSEAWNADRALLETADRILFAAGDERANAEDAAALIRAFPLRGAVHAATSLPVGDVERFGLASQIYTGELVMHQALDRLAVALHRAYGRRTGTETPWETLPPFLQDSNRAAADHMLTKIRLLLPGEDIRATSAEACARAAARFAALTPQERENCRRCEHARWCLFHTLHNWRYAAERDDRLRLHPCLVPYEQLSADDKAKDDSAWEILGTIGEEALP